MFLRSLHLLLAFSLLLANVASMDIAIEIKLDKMQSGPDSSSVGWTNNFMEQTKGQQFVGDHRYRRESSGDGEDISTIDYQPSKEANIEDVEDIQNTDAEDNSQSPTSTISTSSDSTTGSEFNTSPTLQKSITISDTNSTISSRTESNTQSISESSISVLSSTTNSYELIAYQPSKETNVEDVEDIQITDADDNSQSTTSTISTSSDSTAGSEFNTSNSYEFAADEDKVHNLTATCSANSAYVQITSTDANYSLNISSYTVAINNNYTITVKGDNWLTFNITNLSSLTQYTFEVNAEYGNSSSLIGIVNCTTIATSIELNWFTIIGCGVSIFWLVVSLICFFCIRRIRGPRNTIHVNLAVNLLIANGVILASVFYEVEIKSTNAETVFGIPCFVMPIVIHYFYLTSLMWIGLEILYIYRSLVVVLFKPKNPRILIYMIGYLLPACVIAFCILLNYTYFNGGSLYGTDSSCWLFGGSEITLTILAFVLLLLLFNIIMFIIASRAVSSIKRRRDSHIMVIIAERSSKWLCHLLILHPFLGCAWFLGILQFAKWEITPLLFAIFVSLQSFTIFLLYCIIDVCIQQKIRHEDRDLKATEMHNTSTHVDHVIASPVIRDESDGSVLPPPYTLVITGDGHPFEQQDLLPKKRPSLRGKKYSWNVVSTRTSVNTDNSKSDATQFTGATFKPVENSTLM